MKVKIIISTLLIFLLVGGYIFIRLLPTYFINQPIHTTYVMATNLQDFAKKHNYMFFPKLYKSEVEKYLSISIPSAEKEMDKVLIEANKLYDDYLMNPSKELSLEDYGYKLNDYERQLELEIELGVYIDLLEITDKYLLIPFGKLPTDWSGGWAECFMPYFEKYNIDDSRLVELENYLKQKEKELNMIGDKIFNSEIPVNDKKNMRMLYKYPKQKFYYYYYENFNPLKYEKPVEITADDNYTIFIYDNNIPANNFKFRTIYDEKGWSKDYIDIKDDAGYMFEMIINGVELNPKYYIQAHNNCLNSYQGKCIDICEFSKNSNKQIKYTLNPENGEVVKQMEFDNGSVGLENLCNPEGIPGMDI